MCAVGPHAPGTAYSSKEERYIVDTVIIFRFENNFRLDNWFIYRA